MDITTGVLKLYFSDLKVIRMTEIKLMKDGDNMRYTHNYYYDDTVKNKTIIIILVIKVV